MLVFYYVARNTFRECLREPIFYLLLISAIVLIGLFPSLALFVFYEQVKLVMDSSMATTLSFGMVAAVLCASHTISRESRDGTMLMLLSKPVPRWVFVLAKIAGILLALTLFVLICVMGSLISLRVAAKDQYRIDYISFYLYFGFIFLGGVYGTVRNYIHRRPFSSEAIFATAVLFFALILQIQFLPFGSYKDPINLAAIPPLGLLFFAVWIMGAVTVMFSTRLDMVPNLVCCSVIFVLGLVSDYMLGQLLEKGFLFKFLYALIPNWQFFWLADAFAKEKSIPLAYIAWAFCYVALYIVVCCVFAILLFRDREVGGSRA